jgi:hypothetical protein
MVINEGTTSGQVRSEKSGQHRFFMNNGEPGLISFVVLVSANTNKLIVRNKMVDCFTLVKSGSNHLNIVTA